MGQAMQHFNQYDAQLDPDHKHKTSARPMKSRKRFSLFERVTIEPFHTATVSSD